jgi:hypothetical protein
MAAKKGQVRKTARRAYMPTKTKSRRFRSSPVLKKTEASLTRARAQLRKMRARGKDAQYGSLQEAASVTAGGGMAGAANAYFPDGFMGFQVPLLAGAALVGAGMLLENNNQKAAAKYSTCLGAGMLAHWAGGFVEGMTE